MPALRLAQPTPRLACREENCLYSVPWDQGSVEIKEKEPLGGAGYGRLPRGGWLKQADTQRIFLRISCGAEGEKGKAQPWVRVSPKPGSWISAQSVN